MFGLSVRRGCHVSIVCQAVWSRLTWSASCWEEVNRGSEVMDGRVGGDDSKVMWRETRCVSRRFRFPFPSKSQSEQQQKNHAPKRWTSRSDRSLGFGFLRETNRLFVELLIISIGFYNTEIRNITGFKNKKLLETDTRTHACTHTQKHRVGVGCFSSTKTSAV